MVAEMLYMNVGIATPISGGTGIFFGVFLIFALIYPPEDDREDEENNSGEPATSGE